MGRKVVHVPSYEELKKIIIKRDRTFEKGEKGKTVNEK